MLCLLCFEYHIVSCLLGSVFECYAILCYFVMYGVTVCMFCCYTLRCYVYVMFVMLFSCYVCYGTFLSY